MFLNTASLRGRWFEPSGDPDGAPQIDLDSDENDNDEPDPEASFLQPRSRESTRELAAKDRCWTRRSLFHTAQLIVGMTSGAGLGWWSSSRRFMQVRSHAAHAHAPPCVLQEPAESEPPADGPLLFTSESRHAAFDGVHERRALKVKDRRNVALHLPASHPRSNGVRAACAGGKGTAQNKTRQMREHCPRRQASKVEWRRTESARHPGLYYYVNRATGDTQTYPPEPWIVKVDLHQKPYYWNSETNETVWEKPEIIVTKAPGFGVLFCWSFVANTRRVLTLVRTLHRHRLGIFGCDEYALVSEFEIDLGAGLRTSAVATTGSSLAGADVLWSPELRKRASAPDADNVAKLKRVEELAPALHAWRLLRADCRLERMQWVVKVEPETVFFPERLRVQLMHWQMNVTQWPKALMLQSISDGRPVDGGPEILSRSAVDRLSDDWAMSCLDAATNGTANWSLHKCMQRLDVEVEHGFKVHIRSNDSSSHTHETWRSEECREKGLIAFDWARTLQHYLACAYTVEDDPDAGATAEDCRTAEEGDACYRNVTWVIQEGLRNHPDEYAGLMALSRFEDVQGHVHVHNKSLCPRPCPCHVVDRSEQCGKAVLWAKGQGINQHPEWYKGLKPSSSIEVFQAHLHHEVMEGDDRSKCPRACAALPRGWQWGSRPNVEPQSLYCFILVRSFGNELGLVKMQAQDKLGIFQCDGSDVFSNVALKLADGAHAIRIDIDLNVPQVPGTNNAANAPIFVALWEKIIRANRFNSFAWTVKADPDAVFLSWRLVDILKRDEFKPSKREGGAFLENCNEKFHGALEVLSREALMTWGADHRLCPWHPQEDWYMSACLLSLKVPGIKAGDLLGDNYCPEAGSSSCNSWHAAFHPHKWSQDWKGCWDTAHSAS